MTKYDFCDKLAVMRRPTMRLPLPLFIAAIVLPFSIMGCEDIRKQVFPVETIIDPCDPLHNYYYNEQHFINRDYVKEDGTYDYQKLFEAKEIEYSPCNPLKKESK